MVYCRRAFASPVLTSTQATPPPSRAEKKVISKEEWEQKLAEVKISKADLNALVMNYLIIEGHKDAAEKFVAESGTKRGRMAVRAAIQKGDIQEGISRVNDISPLILDSSPQLVFHLRLQQLIEMIRNGDISGALQFAQEDLALRAEENPAFLEELERAMALLAFESPDPASSVARLLDGSQRQRLASELNSAILTAQYQERDPKLPLLLKFLLLAQKQLDEKFTYPAMTLKGTYQ